MCKLTSTTFYSGTRKLLGKQIIHSLHIHDGLLFAGGSAIDGTAGKVNTHYSICLCFPRFLQLKSTLKKNGNKIWQVFSHTTKAVVGSFWTGFDIMHIAANNDFIFTATKCGTIEVWLKERITRVASIKMSGSGHPKITSLTSDMDGGMLYAGSSDGKIQVWFGHKPTNILQPKTEKQIFLVSIVHSFVWDFVAGLGHGLGNPTLLSVVHQVSASLHKLAVRVNFCCKLNLDICS